MFVGGYHHSAVILGEGDVSGTEANHGFSRGLLLVLIGPRGHLSWALCQIFFFSKCNFHEFLLGLSVPNEDLWFIVVSFSLASCTVLASVVNS